jgi:membrane-associated protease RseP (regulator of RpoE activity)
VADVGTQPDGYTINLHPMAFAAWFGMLATALNLFPIGQLDGGHISYAVHAAADRRR